MACPYSATITGIVPVSCIQKPKLLTSLHSALSGGVGDFGTFQSMWNIIKHGKFNIISRRSSFVYLQKKTRTTFHNHNHEKDGSKLNFYIRSTLRPRLDLPLFNGKCIFILRSSLAMFIIYRQSASSKDNNQIQTITYILYPSIPTQKVNNIFSTN